MDGATIERPRPPIGFGIGTGAAMVLGLPAGLYGAALSLLATGGVGAVLAIIGGLAAVRRRRWGVILLVLGGTIVLGVACYVGLGLLQPDGPASGEGHGQAPVR